MKIPTLMLGCVLPFLIGCAAQTPRPVSPIDWKKVERETSELLAPRQVPGPVKTRADAQNGEQLWSLSLLQELTLGLSEGDKTRTLDYIRALVEKAQQVSLPKCTLRMRIKRVPCDHGE